MNVTGTTRVPQYEVERSIRAVKAAAEKEQAAGQAQAVRKAERAEAVQDAASVKSTEKAEVRRRGPQYDAYIPRGPHAPIEDEEDAAAEIAPAGRRENQPAPKNTNGTEIGETPWEAEHKNAGRSPKADEEARAEKAEEAEKKARQAVLKLPGQEEKDEKSAYAISGQEEDEEAYTLPGQKDDEDKDAIRAEQEKKEKATVNTDKVNKEVLTLKTKLEQVERMSRAEKSPKRREELEQRAMQIRREVLWKSSPAYRRQETMPGVA